MNYKYNLNDNVSLEISIGINEPKIHHATILGRCISDGRPRYLLWVNNTNLLWGIVNLYSVDDPDLEKVDLSGFNTDQPSAAFFFEEEIIGFAVALRCVSCNEENEWAEPNQKDGSYKCYQCRNNL